MDTIKLGSKSPDVIFLQGYLELKPDGIFGLKTEQAVQEFQKISGLVQDGIVGAGTWGKLKDVFGISPDISEKDFSEAARILNVPVATIKAINEVESPKGPFGSDTRPTILFEAHIFWSELKKKGIDPNKVLKGNENILSASWNKSLYSGGISEWSRLKKAWEINPEASLLSASLGAFQIMGFNWKSCLCNSVYEYYSRSFCSVGLQLEMFCNFIKSNSLDKYLRSQDWAGFAKKYNGPSYSVNQYDKKLEKAYNKYK